MQKFLPQFGMPCAFNRHEGKLSHFKQLAESWAQEKQMVFSVEFFWVLL